MKWHSIKLDSCSTEDTVRSIVETGPESLWFSGHFPEEPILPGFALLSIVYDTIRLASTENLTVTGLKKIRFKQAVRPGDQLEIKAEKQKNSSAYSFTVIANGLDACTGTLIVDRFYKKC